MIRKSLIALIYETVSIQRWNDHIRPSYGFTELDKQAHKMFYAYVLAKCEGEGNYDPNLLIDGGIYEFLHREILTDIKPPIYHRLMKEKGSQINEWVLNQLKDRLTSLKGNFYEKMCEYYNNPAYAKKEKQILKAAHYYASDWEFKVIYPLNSNTYGIEQVKSEVTRGLSACNTFDGFHRFANNPDLQELLSIIGKLRYQQRWSRAVRMPVTYVMGHMLVVAILSYLCGLEIGVCDKRAENNFFGALFHDLPEVLTRDIVSPVKASVEGLDNLIKEIEDEQMQKVIYPLVPSEWKSELEYFTQNEFDSKVIIDNQIIKTTSEEINEKYNDNSFSPIDGQIIRGCDHLSAYLEAYLSIKYGFASESIQSGYSNLFSQYENKNIAGVDFGLLFDYFKI